MLNLARLIPPGCSSWWGCYNSPHSSAAGLLRSFERCYWLPSIAELIARSPSSRCCNLWAVRGPSMGVSHTHCELNFRNGSSVSKMREYVKSCLKIEFPWISMFWGCENGFALSVSMVSLITHLSRHSRSPVFKKWRAEGGCPIGTPNAQTPSPWKFHRSHLNLAHICSYHHRFLAAWDDWGLYI